MTKSKILVKFKNRDFSPNSRNMGAKSGFLTSKARLVLIKLRQVFVEALILDNFDSEYHIVIETNASGYAIGRILNQLILDNLG